MELLKHMNYEIVCIIVMAIVVIYTAFPARAISGESAFGGDNNGKRCTQNVTPPPKCGTRPGYATFCPYMRNQCKLVCTGDSTCTVCSDISDSCHPCRAGLPVGCLDQLTEDCYGS